MANTDKDTRVVEMQFDAKDFDKGIKQSTKNLEDFKKELNFDDAVRQMRSVTQEGPEMSRTIKEMAENIKTLTIEKTGIGRLSNFIKGEFRQAWQSAARSVEQFVKSLTTDQVKAGMEKFEKLQSSVMTIKAATGESEEQVYKVLKRLNQYTDQTSYNFSDMAQNIGKFTSVGISLEDAERQMEGIANWAARSGGNITEASRAMYNLSQAMGVGALTKIDWKSIENAGMATKEFKNQLIQAGLAVGTLEKKGDKIVTGKKLGKQVEVTYKNLADTLSKKWADTETMQKAFEAYYYEDLYYEGKIASAVETSRQQRDDIRSLLNAQDKDAKLEWKDWENLESEWKKDGSRDIIASRQALIDAAVKQKKLTKEINEEGYTVYKTLAKNGKQIEITTNNLKDFFEKGLADETLISVVLNLDADPLIEMTEKQIKVLQDALGDDDVILKKDWAETMKSAGLATDDVKEAAIQAGLALGTLEKKGDKIFTSKKLGKQMEVTMDQFEESLKMKWFDSDVADKVGKFSDLGKAAYEAAQRCTTFKDVIGALKDMISTGWMNTYTNIFGELTEAMGIFSAICNKASDILSKFIDLRNGILEKWGANGGRNSLWGALIGEAEGLEGDTLFKDAYGLLDAMTAISDAIYDAFWDFVRMFVRDEDKELFDEDRDGFKIKYLAVTLGELTQKVQDFTNKIKDFLFTADPGETETRFDRIKHVVEAIFSVVTLTVNIAKGIGQFVGEILGQLYPSFHVIELLIDYLLQLFTGKVVEGAKKNTIGNFFHTLAEYMKPVTAIANGIIVTVAKMLAAVIEFAQKTNLLKAIGAVFQYVLVLIVNKIVAFVNSGIPQMILGWIGEIVKKIPTLVAKVKELFGSISGYLKNNQKLQSVVASVKEIFSAGNLKGVLTNIRNWVKKLFSKIPELFSGKGGFNVKDLFKRIFEGFLGLFVGSAGAESTTDAIAEAIVEPIADLGKNNAISEVIDEAKPGILATIKSKIKGIWESITGAFDSIVNSDIVTTIRTKIKEIGEKITGAFTDLTNSDVFKGIKTFFAGTDFMGLLTNTKEVMKWLAIFKAGSGIGQVGKGIKQFGKAFKVFGKNLDKLKLDNIFSNMFNISNIINSNNSDSSVRKSFDFGKVGTQLLQIAASIGILVYSAKMLIDITKDLEPEEIKQIGIYMGVLMGALLAAGVISKYFVGNGTSLLGIAAALWLVIKPMKALMEIPWNNGKDWKGGLLEMLAKLGAVMAVIAVAARIAGNVKMKGLISMAVAINLLLIPIRLLNWMGDSAWKGIVKLEAIVFSIAGIAAVMGMTKFTGFKGMLGFATAVTILIIPLKVLSQMPMDEYWRALGGFGAIIIGIAGLVKVCDGVDIKPLGKVVGAIAVLSGVAWLVGKTMNPTQALVGFGSIAALIGVMTLMVWQASKLNEGQISQLATIFRAFAAMVAVIGGALVVIALANVPEATLIEFFGGLILTIGAMAALVAFAKNVDANKIQQLKNVMITFTVAIGVICGSLVALTALKVDERIMLEFFGGLILLLVAIGAMTAMIGNVKPKAVKNLSKVLGLFSLVIAAVGASLVGLAHFNVDPKTIEAFTVGLTALIVGLGYALPKLGKLDPGRAVTGILVLAAAVVAIMGAVAIMIPVVLGAVGSAMEKLAARLKLMSGLLADFFTRMDTISNASMEHSLAVFDSLKDLILKFTGFGNYTKDIQSVMNQLDDLGLGLDLFFLNEKSLPDPESSTSFKILNKFIEMSPSFSNFSVGNLPTELMYLGVGLGLFDAATKNITSAEPVSLSLLQGIFGQADNIEKFASLPLSQFSSQMSTLGGAMSLYAAGAKEVTGLDANADAPDILEAVGILKSVTAALSGEDGKGAFGIPEGLPSEDDLGVFAAQLGALGLAMGSFSEGAKGMDEAGPKKAIEAIGLFAAIGGYLTPESLGFTKAFDNANIHAGEGTGTLGQFALDIGALGTALGEFSSLTSDTSFDNGFGALEHFQDLNQRLTKDRLDFLWAFKEAEVTDTVLNDFSKDIGALGRALKEFATSVLMDDGTQTDFDHAMGALNFLTTMSSRLSNIKVGTSLYTLLHGSDYTLGEMADDVTLLGESLASMSSAMSSAQGFNADDITAGLTVIEQLVRILNQLNIMKPETGGVLSIGDYIGTLSNVIQGLTDTDIGGRNGFFDENGNGVSFAGKIAAFARSLSAAFNEAGDIDTQALEAFRNIATGLSALMTVDTSSEFEYPGKMIALGIETGIRNGESGVVQAAIDVVTAAINAANETADSHSPSRVFQQLGEYMDLGLAKGLYGEQNTVENASADMTNSVIDRAGLIMGAVSQALADSTDLRPTVTPVLDLSGITSRSGEISTIFDNYALNLNNALDRAAAATGYDGTVSVMVQNPTDLSTIQSSMYTLQTEINNLHTAISNMKIVLNTGVLAGGLTDDIDLNLGRQGLYAGRRN